MTDHTTPSNRPFRNFVIAAGALVAVAIALMWCWNTVAGDLFGAPTAKLRHAVAAELLVLLTGRLLATGRRYRHT